MTKTFSPVCFGIVVLAGIATMVLPGGAACAVPCAGTSTVIATPDCGAYCPAGDMDMVTVTVTVRDCYGTPLPGLAVVVEPIIGMYGDPPSPGHCFCPGEEAKTCITDASATCSVNFSDFGGCDGDDCGLEFSAVCEGIELGPSNRIITASPDANADCQVNLIDFISFATMYITGECCGDYDCDGIIILTDFIVFASHYTHHCP
jgi:hypothetical protein